jgi:hypothetical protein
MNMNVIDIDWWRRYELATQSPQGEILNNLADDVDIDIRHRVARNLNTPAKTLTKLAKEKNEVIRRAVANNPNTPEAVKLWLKTSYAGMSLAEFMAGVTNESI